MDRWRSFEVNAVSAYAKGHDGDKNNGVTGTAERFNLGANINPLVVPT